MSNVRRTFYLTLKLTLGRTHSMSLPTQLPRKEAETLQEWQHSGIIWCLFCNLEMLFTFLLITIYKICCKLTEHGLRNLSIQKIVHWGDPSWHHTQDNCSTHTHTHTHTYTVNAALKEGYFHTSSNYTKQTLYSMDIQPACYQSQHKVDPYK